MSKPTKEQIAEALKFYDYYSNLDKDCRIRKTHEHAITLAAAYHALEAKLALVERQYEELEELSHIPGDEADEPLENMVERHKAEREALERK